MKRPFVFLLVWVLVFSLPLENQLQIPGIGVFSRLLGIGVAIVWAIHVLGTMDVRPPQRFHIAMFAFLLWAALSVVWSVAPGVSTTYVFTLAQLFVLTLVVWDVAFSFERVASLLQAFVLGAFVAVSQVLSTFLLSGIGGFFRSRATIPGFNPNDAALLFALALPMAWFLASSESTSRRLRILNAAYVPCACLAIPLTGSRSGVAAVLAFLILVGAKAAAGRPERVVASVFVALALFVGLTHVLPQVTLERLQEGVPQIESGNLSGRGEVWHEALDEFWAHPILGLGAGDFVVVSPLFRTCGASAYSLLGGTRQVCTGESAHSVFLTDMAELGIIGLMLFGWILATVIKTIPGQPRDRRWLWVQCLTVWLVAVSLSPWELDKKSWLLLVLVVAGGAVRPSADSPLVESSVPRFG